MKLKDVSLSNIGEGDKKSTNGPAWLLCVPSVRWLLFSSTAVQLGDSFTVAFPPSGHGQSNCKEPTQGCSNRPVCRTFQSHRDQPAELPISSALLGKTDTRTNYLTQDSRNMVLGCRKDVRVTKRSLFVRHGSFGVTSWHWFVRWQLFPNIIITSFPGAW